MISKLDFIGVPSQDSERSRSFYVDTLGLRPDEHSRFEAWAGETCLGIWEPERLGMDPQLVRHRGDIGVASDEPSDDRRSATSRAAEEDRRLRTPELHAWRDPT